MIIVSFINQIALTWNVNQQTGNYDTTIKQIM